MLIMYVFGESKLNTTKLANTARFERNIFLSVNMGLQHQCKIIYIIKKNIAVHALKAHVEVYTYTCALSACITPLYIRF